jgi:glyoxylase-like metal-dependent hydrolase (beta-lactamase superfamily II)
MIQIKIFVFNSFQENTYILYDETGEAVIIDAGCQNQNEIAALNNFIVSQKLKPVQLLGTHGHIDHILGNRILKDTYQITYRAHEGDQFLIENASAQGSMFGLEVKKPPLPDSFLADSELIHFGNSELEVIHLPGHSPGGVGFYCKAQGFIVVGDVLFSNSIGRTDLPGGDFDQLINCIKSRLLVLPENTIVYPGHGPQTTIGVEKRNNPFLH